MTVDVGPNRAGGSLLEVDGLTVRIPTDDGLVRAVEDVSFTLDSGEVLGVVGESGSGKSVTAMSILRLLPKRASLGGSILFDGVDLAQLDETAMRSIRGKEIAIIFQDPMTALNPVHKIGEQVVEMIQLHQDLGNKAARAEALEILDLVGIPDPGTRIDQYPHEFSGGMRQRVVIAIAVANRPRLLIADEPTTALDVTIQAQVMAVIDRVRKEVGAAMMLITHDLGLVAGTADRVQVMYAGRLFESADIDTIFKTTANPYTEGLLASLPRLGARQDDRLPSIPGNPPSSIRKAEGCPFSPRCIYADDICREHLPGLDQVGPGHVSRCHHPEQVLAFGRRSSA